MILVKGLARSGLREDADAVRPFRILSVTVIKCGLGTLSTGQSCLSLGNAKGVKGLWLAILTRTVHLVALVVARRPAVALPGHGDTLHLPTAAGELPRAAALLWNTIKSPPVWSNLRLMKGDQPQSCDLFFVGGG